MFVVSFNDGSEIINERLETTSTDPLWLAKTVKSKLRRLDARSVIDSANPIGDITPPPDVPSAPAPPPNPAISEFQLKLRRLQQMTKAVSLGVIPDTLSVLVNLRDDIKSAVQADPSLLDLF